MEAVGGQVGAGVHTPDTLQRAVQNAATVALGEASWQLQRVSGIYHAKGGAPFGSFHYDRLQAEGTDAQITLLVTPSLRSELSSGSSYTFSGQVSLQAQKDRLDVRFRVTEVLERSDRAKLERLQAIAALRERKVTRSPRRVLGELLRSGRRPRIALVSGRGAIVGQDVRGALGDALTSYLLSDIFTNLSRPEEVARTLSSLSPSDFDVLALVRGGGELGALESLEVAEAAVALPLPFITAVGHAADEPLVQEMAHLAFLTPTDLGHHLRDLAHEAHQAPLPDVSHTVTVPDPSVLARLERENAELRQQVAHQQKPKRSGGWRWLVLLGIVVYLVLAMQGIVPDVVTPLIEMLGSLPARLRAWVSA